MREQRKPTKHLFFIDGPVPTEEQEDEADNLNGFVCYRNALMVVDGEATEDFDQLHGNIPETYLKAARLKARGIETDPTPLAETTSTIIDNGDGTKTETVTWRPNVGASA